MKTVAILSSVSYAFAAVSGDLKLTYNKNQVQIAGNINGLHYSITGGIHVHDGTNCSAGNGSETLREINARVGGHLMNNNTDGWAATTYDTGVDGVANIAVEATGYTLAGFHAVNDRCIVLHGNTSDNTTQRVAIGKIKYIQATQSEPDRYEANIGVYPGPKHYETTPSGTLAVAMKGDNAVWISGQVKGLRANMRDYGIGVHSGTDCTGGGWSSIGNINSVVGSRLRGYGDAWLGTTYTSNATGFSQVSIKTPAYTHKRTNFHGSATVPGLEDHCIVMHARDGSRIAIGKVKCGSNGCKATMTDYPEGAWDPWDVDAINTGAGARALASGLIFAFIATMMS